MSDLAPVGTPRSVVPNTSPGVLDDGQMMHVRHLPDPVPVRCVPDQVRHQDCPCRPSDHRCELFDVDVERVRLDIDKYRDQTRTQQNGAMSVENVTADVTTSSPGRRSSNSTAR